MGMRWLWKPELARSLRKSLSLVCQIFSPVTGSCLYSWTIKTVREPYANLVPPCSSLGPAIQSKMRVNGTLFLFMRFFLESIHMAEAPTMCGLGGATSWALCLTSELQLSLLHHVWGVWSIIDHHHNKKMLLSNVVQWFAVLPRSRRSAPNWMALQAQANAPINFIWFHIVSSCLWSLSKKNCTKCSQHVPNMMKFQAFGLLAFFPFPYALLLDDFPFHLPMKLSW